MLQLIINIAFNSIKYTFEGGIEIIFSQSEDSKYLTIKIKDTGIGMAENQLEKIDKLFGLLDENIIQHKTGIGIGLVVSRSIINAMNGTLMITSKLNIGTTCKANIPLVLSERKVIRDMSINDPLNFKELDSSAVILKGPPKVLIVDDEPFIQLALTVLLKKLGCIVDKASNGQIGVNMVANQLEKSNPYDIVFMDINMPVMNGYEATKLLRENPEVECPIICISAQDSIQHKALCKEAGMNDILNKPSNIISLKNILTKYKLI